MHAYPTIYIDEAGNTGSHVLDTNQPYFVLSAVHFTKEELKQIQKDIPFDKELHFVEMKRSHIGRQIIKKMLEHPLINESHISFEFINKQFCIYAQIVDMTIEPVFYYIYKEDLYKNRVNIILANCLYTLCRAHPNQEAVKDFLFSFENMIRTQTKENIENFYINVEILFRHSDAALAEILQHVKLSHIILEDILPEDKSYCLDTTVTSLFRMVDLWFKRLGEKLNIITDESKPIRDKMIVINNLSKINIEQQLVGYDTRKQIFPLPINSISMVDSKKNFGVQLADLIASSFAFAFGNATSKYERFQTELKKMLFDKQLKGLLIQPATADYLSQEVDNSNDSSPIDFIMQHLYK